MRANLLVVLLTFLSLSVSAASSCHQQILESTTDRFHKFIEAKIKTKDLSDSQKEFYKTIGFKSIGTESGIKLILNMKMSELKSITSEHEFNKFNEILSEFFETNKRIGSQATDNSYFPKESDLPCMDDSLFLTEHKHCLNGKFDLEENQLIELQKAIEGIFKATGITLSEINPSSFNSKKTLEVTSQVPLLNLSGFTLDTELNCQKSGLQIVCDFKVPGEESLRISDGTRSAEITLKYSKESIYEISDDLGENTYHILKSNEDFPDGQVIADFEILPNSIECKKVENKIKCIPGISPDVLRVIPEAKADQILSVDIKAESGFYIEADEDKDPLFSYLRPIVLVKGQEDIASLGSVDFVDLKSCSVISLERKLIKCPKLLEPYDIEAKKTISETQELASYTVATKSELGELSLEVTKHEMDSLSQMNLLKVKAAGVVISPDSFGDLGIKLNIPEGVSFDSANSLLTGERKEESYSYEISISKEDEVKASVSVKVSKHVADNSYFFEKNNQSRFCRLNLMKVNGVKDFVNVGNDIYASEFFDIEVEASKDVSCSSVQRTSGSTQVMCNIPKDKFKGTVKVKLSSNGNIVRTTSCEIRNHSYDFSSDKEEDDDDDEEDNSRGKRRKSKSAMSEIGETFADAFSSSIPKYMESKYGNQNNFQYQNPLMYQPYYYGGPFMPSGYMSNPWDTRYIFDTRSY